MLLTSAAVQFHGRTPVRSNFVFPTYPAPDHDASPESEDEEPTGNAANHEVAEVVRELSGAALTERRPRARANGNNLVPGVVEEPCGSQQPTPTHNILREVSDPTDV